MGSDSDEVRAAVRALRPIDDEFFKQLAADKGAIQEIVQAALSDSTLVVERCQPQEGVDVVGRRSIRADALCTTPDGRLINVEAQVGHKHDDVRRVRLHLSLLTAANAPKGAEFKDLPEVAVVYLADYDPFGDGCLTYTVERTFKETGKGAENGEREVYVNGTVRDGSPLSRIMEVLCDQEALDYAVCPKLSDRKDFVRNSEEAQQEMAESVQALLDRKIAESMEAGRERGLEEGREQERAALLASLVAAGVLTPEAAEEWMKDRETSE